jgi:hypothetical protein
MRPLSFALAALLSLAAGAHAREDERPPLTVYFADGSSQPLRAWSFSYEYGAWRKGESPTRGTVSRRESGDLLMGKRVVELGGLFLEIEYAGATLRALATVDQAGKRSALKPEAPTPEALLPQAGKDMVVQVRGLDLQGETLTGGKCIYCLLSYTALVECAPDPDQRVVKIRFP